MLQLEAVKKNIGIASLPCFLGDLAAGVQRIDNSDPSQGDWVWVLAHRDMVRNAKVRILMEFIHVSFQTHKNALEGLRDRCVELLLTPTNDTHNKRAVSSP